MAPSGVLAASTCAQGSSLSMHSDGTISRHVMLATPAGVQCCIAMQLSICPHGMPSSGTQPMQLSANPDGMPWLIHNSLVRFTQLCTPARIDFNASSTPRHSPPVSGLDPRMNTIGLPRFFVS